MKERGVTHTHETCCRFQALRTTLTTPQRDLKQASIFLFHSVLEPGGETTVPPLSIDYHTGFWPPKVCWGPPPPPLNPSASAERSHTKEKSEHTFST